MAAPTTGRISVIMTHFGCEKFLAEAVASVLGQTYPNLELHVVDDASPTDEWLEVLAPFREDPRLSIYQSDTNVGTYRLRNRLLAMTHGELVCFHDADDRSLPDRFAKQLPMTRRIPIVGCSLRRIDEAGHVLSTVRMRPFVNLWMAKGHGFPMLIGSALIRREVFDVLGGFDGMTRFGADYDFFVRARHLCWMRNLWAPLFDWRLRSGSLTTAAETALNSEARQEYERGMWERDAAVRKMKRAERPKALRARENDVDFVVKRIS